MSILMVANCPGCGKVFQKNLRNLCMNCVKLLESEFDVCFNYLRSNRKATTSQLSIDTGVSEQQIYTWIKDRRLPASDYPNLTYPCNSCSGPIRQEQMCYPCRSRLTREIRELQEKETIRTQSQGIGFRSRPSRY
ncbi:flagellar protein [Paenibacillus radicis (ex Xue et al. 2023)]|uniref:Flagellar protein n=1 Tax=Paenibacillus radicis (ex Xue et al. 2023) TaxID=2972489 RepID=A0ABT1YVB6_9BACL|nr:flagellar protein [Paenibacillus radicis (ex Xue et al. 2023)]MCR8636883.1 flagellar protein [Paenibacillus radicis (ex Xue et al. 2023)]